MLRLSYVERYVCMGMGRLGGGVMGKWGGGVMGRLMVG